MSSVSGVSFGLSETGDAGGNPDFCSAGWDCWALSFTAEASETGNAGFETGFCVAGFADGISAGDREVSEVLEPPVSGASGCSVAEFGAVWQLCWPLDPDDVC